MKGNHQLRNMNSKKSKCGPQIGDIHKANLANMQLSEPRTYETSTESKYEIAVKNFKLYQFMKKLPCVTDRRMNTERTLHYQKKIFKTLK